MQSSRDNLQKTMSEGSQERGSPSLPISLCPCMLLLYSYDFGARFKSSPFSFSSTKNKHSSSPLQNNQEKRNLLFSKSAADTRNSLKGGNNPLDNQDSENDYCIPRTSQGYTQKCWGCWIFPPNLSLMNSYIISRIYMRSFLEGNIFQKRMNWCSLHIENKINWHRDDCFYENQLQIADIKIIPTNFEKRKESSSQEVEKDLCCLLCSC